MNGDLTAQLLTYGKRFPAHAAEPSKGRRNLEWWEAAKKKGTDIAKKDILRRAVGEGGEGEGVKGAP